MTFSAAYDFTLDRYRALIRARRQRKGESAWRHYAAVSALYVLSLVAVMAWHGTLPDAAIWSGGAWWPALGGLLLLYILVAAIDGVFNLAVYPLVFRRYSQANQHIDVTIGDDGLRWKSNTVEGALKWAAIQDVTRLDDASGAVLWIGKIEGFLLPADSFESRQIFNDALQFIERKISVAQ